MNPRYRRMLIPGLLAALIVVVLVTSIAREARGAVGVSRGSAVAVHVVCTITDSRIGESSGLALSVTRPGLAYTINDSGNAPIVYAIRMSTGEVAGTTRVLGGALRDTEALALDAAGTLWIADTGDNRNRRRDAALYALPEPGIGDHTVVATRYPIRYPGVRPNVEALLIDPVTGDKFLATKGLLAGELFKLPSTMSAARPNPATPVAVTLPAMVTDGAMTPDGRFAAIRNYGTMSVYDTGTWRLIRTDGLPAQRQGETLAVVAGGQSALIGTEGNPSQLLRVPLKLSREAIPSQPRPAADPGAGEGSNWWRYGLPAAIALGAGALVLRRRH